MQVHHENQIVEGFARGETDGAEAFRLVHFAIAEKCPDLAVGHVDEAAIVHVFHEPRLIDGAEGPEPHGHGRELPEVRHQPGVRIAREPLAAWSSARKLSS